MPININIEPINGLIIGEDIIIDDREYEIIDNNIKYLLLKHKDEEDKFSVFEDLIESENSYVSVLDSKPERVAKSFFNSATGRYIASETRKVMQEAELKNYKISFECKIPDYLDYDEIRSLILSNIGSKINMNPNELIILEGDTE